MRSRAPPFWYVRTSNIPSASVGEFTSNSTGRVDASESVSNATVLSMPKVSQRPHSGLNASHAAISMNVAKASLSQMPFHQRMVTRSPNHIWASSCATTSATSCRSGCVALTGSTRRRFSLNVMHPRFSIAPAAKSGSASSSTLSPGYGMP